MKASPVASLVVALSFAVLPLAGETDPLAGIWAAQMTFTNSLRGDLVVRRSGPSWRATLAGAEAASQGESLRFDFGGKRGLFRGSLTEDGRSIRGFWLQPASSVADQPNPAGMSQPFASPLVLQRIGRNVWRGTVRPLEDRFRLYLRIFRGPDGALVAVFRNPDQNSNGGATQFRVSREGDDVVFTAQGGDSILRHVATLLSTPDRLRITWPDVGIWSM